MTLRKTVSRSSSKCIGAGLDVLRDGSVEMLLCYYLWHRIEAISLLLCLDHFIIYMVFVPGDTAILSWIIGYLNRLEPQVCLSPQI